VVVDIQAFRHPDRKGVLRHGVKTTGRAIKPFKSNGRTNWFPSSRKLYEVLQPRVDTWWMGYPSFKEKGREMLNEIEVDWPRGGGRKIRNSAEIERLRDIYCRKFRMIK